ncbi:MAG: SIR2 family NAD-dependent protein deacylase [Saprospiraceae bacterium]
MKKLVVLTGAGISAESGISTFRDADGLWYQHRIEDVASPEGWRRDPELVLEFYNQRRRQLQTVTPNAGHLGLAALEADFDVQIITQNVDDLHERAGSSKVLHLHGELLKSRSERHLDLVYDCIGDLRLGDLCARGCQLRPHIVWFGESVPMMTPAIEIAREADIFAVIGTSLQVYPAASLTSYVPQGIPFFYIDIDPAVNFQISSASNLVIIAAPATTGVQMMTHKLLPV